MVDTMKKTEEALNAKADASKVEEKMEAERAKQSSDTVTVCCGIPMGQRFVLANGDVVKLEGIPMSHLVSAEKGNARLPAGKYGTTVIKESQWEEILARYGKCDFIVNGVIFAEKTLESAEAKGRELRKKRMGFEQAEKEGSTKEVKKED